MLGTQNEKKITNDDEQWTTDYTIQTLKHDLATFEVNGSRKYYEQAKEKIYRIPVHRPTPPFNILLADLTKRMRQELRNLDKDTKIFVLKQAVGRIFEDINSKYYHDSVSKILTVVLAK